MNGIDYLKQSIWLISHDIRLSFFNKLSDFKIDFFYKNKKKKQKKKNKKKNKQTNKQNNNNNNNKKQDEIKHTELQMNIYLRLSLTFLRWTSLGQLAPYTDGGQLIMWRCR